MLRTIPKHRSIEVPHLPTCSLLQQSPAPQVSPKLQDWTLWTQKIHFSHAQWHAKNWQTCFSSNNPSFDFYVIHFSHLVSVKLSVYLLYCRSFKRNSKFNPRANSNTPYEVVYRCAWTSIRSYQGPPACSQQGVRILTKKKIDIPQHHLAGNGN